MASTYLKVTTTGMQLPRMNSLMERWIRTCGHELLNRTLIRNQSHLLHALREFENFYNGHRPHRAWDQAPPLAHSYAPPLRQPINEPAQIRHLGVHRRDRLGRTLHKDQHAA
jgi:putative transposase